MPHPGRVSILAKILGGKADDRWMLHPPWEHQQLKAATHRPANITQIVLDTLADGPVAETRLLRFSGKPWPPPLLGAVTRISVFRLPHPKKPR